jgi:hypothetical protein
MFSSVTMAEVGIGVIRDGGLLIAGSIGIFRTTGSVDHVLHHQCMQLRMSVRIGNLSREELVELNTKTGASVPQQRDTKMEP